MSSNLCQVKKEDASECTVLSKYKCPSCLVKYCSVACFKLHKELEYCKKADREEKKNLTSSKSD